MKIEILCALFLVIALLLINLMLGISPLRHSSYSYIWKQSAFLVWKFDRVSGVKVWLAQLGLFIDLFSWDQWQPVQWVQLTAGGPHCLTVVVLPGVQAEGFKWCTLAFSPSHVASHTENNLHVCLQNLSLGESVWNNYSLFLCKCFYQGQFL